ncbi:yaiI/yqxD family protein [Enterococcus sp. 10A9_DIV0425]|uniref:UPF0178 protein A5844_001119 n=1 Tax=Candidatus Enterococcus wittei TaxID=1987383 RepID=A0A242K079_9ENTE|nr:YaiI/YqxD family protein [Enterococcus sp. 10A9_DIV0425]OTP10985.1 yaiI/yqxD family protein [Enterococcus sp. 10A9_DIV0425]THE16250.1 YaiI/YqxD family protein [Enterococcus hirae]
MRIFIDGDGSPVKEDVIEIATAHQVEVMIVTSVDHYTNKEYPSTVHFIYVDKGADSADYKIVGMIRKGDLLVTQDYGLASLVLPKGVRVFHQSGKEFDATNINGLLEQRYQSSQMRKAGVRTKGPKPFTPQDHQRFKKALKGALTVQWTE